MKTNVETVRLRILDYVTQSLSDEIPTCEKMKWSMQRFINDLKETENGDSTYYMDWDEVFRFYVWSRMFKHTKGTLAGQHIDLHVSQLYEASNIFGFKYRKNGYRRFREVYIQKARKNAKTQTLALIASYVAFLSKEQEEIYIAGWSKEQSNLCYHEIVRQLEPVEMLKDKWKEAYHFVTIKKNGTTIKPLSREARKTGDGTNPSLSIIDEYGTAHETNEIVDVQKSGMIARKQPLIIYITTAGFNLHYPAFNFYEYCSDVLNPDTNTENDSIFIAIYEQDKDDNFNDETLWVKSNPIVTTYPEGMHSLREAHKLALDQPSQMRNFLTKNMNIWVDNKDDAFIPRSKWDKQTISDEEMKTIIQGATFYYGIDLSATTDLTSIGWVAVKNGKFLVGQHSFMPKDKFRERMSRDKVRFDLFVERGELTLTPGSVVDYNYVKAKLLEMANQYGAKEVGFDVWNAVYLSNELASEGLTMVEIPQSISKLTEPTKRFRERLYDGSLYHGDDHLLSWAISNAVIQQDHNENIKISKLRSSDRIDPVDAIINAFARAMYDDQQFDINSWVTSEEWSF